MNWRRAMFAAACLVLAAAIAYPLPAWASATTGVTIVAAEEDPDVNADKPSSEASRNPRTGLFPTTGDSTGFVVALAIACALACVVAGVKHHHARARERRRMHVIDEQHMRDMNRTFREQRRKP